jgi:DNA replication protein DnaC
MMKKEQKTKQAKIGWAEFRRGLIETLPERMTKVQRTEPVITPAPEISPEEQKAKRVLARINQHYRGTRFEGKRLFDLKRTDLVEFLIAELKNPKQFYLLIGPPGCGKTHGSICFAYELSNMVVELTAVQFIEMLIRKEDFTPLRTATVLIINDLGFEPPGWKSDEFKAMFRDVMDARWKALNKITIINTNLEVDQIKALYDDKGKGENGPDGPFISRFNQDGCVKTVKSEDLRKAK